MSIVLAPRLSASEVVEHAVLGPFSDAPDVLRGPFAMFCCAFDYLLMPHTAHSVRWPDGAAGRVVFGARQDRDMVLRQVYEVARAAMEQEALAALAGAVQ